LEEMAGRLGSDCPFFLSQGPQLATGRGEVLTPLDIDLSGLYLVLISPSVHVGTAEVYANTRPTERTVDLPGVLVRSRLSEWQTILVNTMEPHVLRAHPNVANAKRILIEAGAQYAAMSGSGSTVYGLFNQPLPALDLPNDHRSWIFRL
jgi:4-diphosphocytidyl-2-C-methyl-D-erythritol kinase